MLAVGKSRAAGSRERPGALWIVDGKERNLVCQDYPVKRVDDDLVEQ